MRYPRAVLYQGLREDIVTTWNRKGPVLDSRLPEREPYTKKLESWELAQIWQRSKPVLILDPPDPSPFMRSYSPSAIGFTREKISTKWEKWIRDKQLRVTPVELGPIVLARNLRQGIQGIRFMDEAATWYVKNVGCSITRLRTELLKLAAAQITEVTLQDCLLHIDETNDDFREFNRLLGTRVAGVTLLQRIPVPTEVVPLLYYLKNASPHETVTAPLAALMQASLVDNPPSISPMTALILLILQVQRDTECPLKSKAEILSSSVDTMRLLDLYQLFDYPWLQCGSEETFWYEQ